MARFSANFAFVTETNVVSVQQAQNVVAAQQRAAGWILYLRWFRNGCFSSRQGSPTPMKYQLALCLQVLEGMTIDARLRSKVLQGELVSPLDLQWLL